jgi:hypothetical protein
MLQKTDVEILEASPKRCPREIAEEQLHKMIAENRINPNLDLARQIASLVTILEGP